MNQVNDAFDKNIRHVNANIRPPQDNMHSLLPDYAVVIFCLGIFTKDSVQQTCPINLSSPRWQWCVLRGETIYYVLVESTALKNTTIYHMLKPDSNISVQPSLQDDTIHVIHKIVCSQLGN